MKFLKEQGEGRRKRGRKGCERLTGSSPWQSGADGQEDTLPVGGHVQGWFTMSSVRGCSNAPRSLLALLTALSPQLFVPGGRLSDSSRAGSGTVINTHTLRVPKHTHHPTGGAEASWSQSVVQFRPISFLFTRVKGQGKADPEFRTVADSMTRTVRTCGNELSKFPLFLSSLHGLIYIILWALLTIHYSKRHTARKYPGGRANHML